MVRVKFIWSGNLLERIGHLALEPDCYLKSGLINWRPRYRGIVLSHSKNVVNPCLLRYWGGYLKVISNPILVKVLRPLERHPLLNFDSTWVHLPEGQKAKPVPAIYQVQTKYEAKFGDQPLLWLSESDRVRGWNSLQTLGVPRDAWFVCLHGREDGYLPHLDYHSFRDVDIDSYLMAAEAIVDRGGWVIRMGDPTMKPLPTMDRVIDYVHSDIRSDWMDVFCFAQCKFLLGSASGAFCVPHVFGVPLAIANYAPMEIGPFSSRDIWIPKLYWSRSEHRYLTYDEILRSTLGLVVAAEELDAACVSLLDNEPEDIRDLAEEMMDRLDGSIRYTKEDQVLQERFKTLLHAEPLYATSAHVGRDFLRNHSSLFDPPPYPGILPESGPTASPLA